MIWIQGAMGTLRWVQQSCYMVHFLCPLGHERSRDGFDIIFLRSWSNLKRGGEVN